MSATTLSLPPLIALRIRAENPDHHLWNNHGTWFLHYTVHPTPLTKQRIRRSLGTKDLPLARERRDVFFHASGHPSRAPGLPIRLSRIT